MNIQKNKSSEHLPSSQPETSVSRRSILKLVGVGATLAAIDKVNWLAERSGEALDAIISPEHIIKAQIPVLEPRKDITPPVSPETLSEPVSIPAHYDRENDQTTLHFDPEHHLVAEHTGTHIRDTDFVAAGTAIITTAEGLEDGEQAYSALYKGTTQLIAVGYTGGMYAYEPDLNKKNDTGEWVRITTEPDADSLSAHVHTEWQNPTTPHNMMIENVVEGTKTLHDIGYKPWPAVLPSTKMPDMVPKKLTEDLVAKNLDEVISPDSSKTQFFTEKGDMVDIVHLEAKAGETFDLFVQLQYMQLTKDPQPVAGARYSEGNDVRFEFAVDPQSLQPENIYDTAFSLMTNTGMLMEGISQRYIFEKVKLVDEVLPDMGGLSSEDPFSNSLGVVGMLTQLKEAGIDQKIQQPLTDLQRQYPGASMKEMYLHLEKAFASTKQAFAQHVLHGTAKHMGVRQPEEFGVFSLPRGLSPLISTKINDKDAATPTRINLGAAGINPNNPDVCFHVTNVPALEPTFLRFLEEYGL